jgi:hypothetical protein
MGCRTRCGRGCELSDDSVWVAGVDVGADRLACTVVDLKLPVDPNMPLGPKSLVFAVAREPGSPDVTLTVFDEFGAASVQLNPVWAGELARLLVNPGR